MSRCGEFQLSVITASQQMGGAIGLAILGGAATLASSLTHDTAGQATDLWLQAGDGHLRSVNPDQRVRRDPRETHAQARLNAQPSPTSGNRSLVSFDCPPPQQRGWAVLLCCSSGTPPSRAVLLPI